MLYKVFGLSDPFPRQRKSADVMVPRPGGLPRMFRRAFRSLIFDLPSEESLAAVIEVGPIEYALTHRI